MHKFLFGIEFWILCLRGAKTAMHGLLFERKVETA